MTSLDRTHLPTLLALISLEELIIGGVVRKIVAVSKYVYWFETKKKELLGGVIKIPILGFWQLVYMGD